MNVARLYNVVGMYYVRLGDVNTASKHADMGYALAEKADDNVRRTRALSQLARISRLKGDFRAALELARRAQVFAGQIGNFYREIDAMEQEAIAWLSLGNFSQAADICAQARQLVVAAGLEGTQHEISVLSYEAGIFLYQTAYLKSRATLERILKYSSAERFVLFHGNSQVSIAMIDVALGRFKSEGELAAALESPRQIFASSGYWRGLPICDMVMGDFLFLNGRPSEALKIYDKCLGSFRGENVQMFSWCTQKLGDIALVRDVQSATHWATASLAYGKTTANKSVAAWALRSLGDIFREDGDDETSGSLFQLALEEFTHMGIYRGRAECLLRLGEIARRRGEDGRAASYSSQARDMFLEAGMVTEAREIDV